VAVECHAPCLNRCLIPQSHEEITGTLAVRALFIAVISGCLAVCTFAPIRCFDSSCVNATAALFAAGFGTAAVCDPNVVTGAATLGTTRNRQFSLHLLMIRLARVWGRRVSILPVRRAEIPKFVSSIGPWREVINERANWSWGKAVASGCRSRTGS
jgi:hypothetical protein